MNILEMEDMVKGLPDQVLRQYAQFPDPQIPQFLALSEVQRREDMRQRFQSQQQGMEPTVKDQILQGGIASAMPQGAPPMDQGMAPPMAPPMAPQAPMGPEMGPPQGPVMAYRGGMMPYSMAEGGIVGGAKEFGKVYADRVREQASTPQGLLSFVPGVGGLMAAAEQLSSLRQYFPSTPEATGFGKYFPETNKAGLSLGRVDTVRADPNLVDPESDALDREYQALISSQQNAMYAPFHSTMTGFDPTAGGTYDPGSQVMSSIGGPNIPGGMSDGGMVPGGIVQMYDGKVVPNESRAARRIRLTAERNAALQAGDIETANEIERQLRIGTPAGTLSRGAAAQQAAINQPMFERMGIVPTMETPEVSMDEPSFDLTLPVAPTASAAQGNVNAPIVPPPATDGGIATLDRTTPTMAMDNQVMNMLSKALAPQASPLEAEYEALVRSAMAEGLPPPVDLAPYAQAAETRAQTARDEAKRMAWAAALGRFGAAVAEGDIAKGIREATTDVQQGLKEGAREARTEEARAEALRLQSAESQRQATIQARQFELQSIGSLAQIAREKGASERQAQLTATNIYADYRAQLQRNVADLKQQGALNARSFADAMENAEKMAIDYIEALIQPTEEQKQEVLNKFRRQALATYGFLLSEDQLKKVSASLAKKKSESQEGKPNSRKYEVSEVPGT